MKRFCSFPLTQNLAVTQAVLKLMILLLYSFMLGLQSCATMLEPNSNTLICRGPHSFPLHMCPAYPDESHQGIIDSCSSWQEKAAPRAQFMEEEELLFLGKGYYVSIKKGRALELKKQMTELPPVLAEPLGKFTITFFAQVFGYSRKTAQAT